MQFLKKDITKRLRNGEPYSAIYSPISSGIINSSGSIGGDADGGYLPAKLDENGTWIVDLSLVHFVGSIYADGEVSALGNGSSSGGTSTSSTEVIDNLTSTSTTAALSANQGRILYNKFYDYYTAEQINALFSANGNGSGEGTTVVDLSNYYTKAQVDDKIANVTVDLSGYAKESWVKNQGYLTTLPDNVLYSESLINYFTKNEIDTKLSSKSDTGHTHSISAITNLQTTLDGKSNTGHSHSNYSVTSHTHSNYSTTGHSHNISDITNLQSTLDGKSGTGHSHSNYSTTAHTHSYLPLSGGTVSGDLAISGNIIALGEISSASDARLKKNIITLQNRGLLNPVTYIKDGKPSIGFVAQDVQENYPELVSQLEDGYLTLHYSQITAVLSAQINELYDVIDKLKNEIKELKNNK